MKKLITIFIIVFTCNLFAQKMNVTNNLQTKITTEKISDNKLIITNQIKDLNFNYIDVKNEKYLEISIPEFDVTPEVGSPQLPAKGFMLEIPTNADAKVKILSAIYKDIPVGDYKLFPKQASVSKSAKEVKFVKDNTVYHKNAFQNQELAYFEDYGIMRDIRLGSIVIRPVNYNPVTNILRVYYDLKIEVEWNINPAKGEAYRAAPHTYQVLQIVSARMFESTLQPFIQWKTKQGYKVQVAYTDQSNVGTTTTSIKAFLKGLWDNRETIPAPDYVLFVGDVAQIPAFASTTMDVHPSDLKYCEYTGDYLPEVYYGRMSGTTITQIQAQIDKTLAMEQLTIPDLSYLGKVELIAGVETYPTSLNCVNNTVQYGQYYYFNQDSLGVATTMYLDPASGNYASQIISEVNSGRGFVNYTAHGDVTMWSSPQFNNANVNNLTNVNKYPLCIGNCCLAAKFDENCFAEAWLQKANGGAVMYIGASNSTYWVEDAAWSVGAATSSLLNTANTVPGTLNYNSTGAGTNAIGVYDAVVHNHNEAVANWAITAGQMVRVGNLAVQSQPSSSYKNYYWEIYHCFGDPTYIHYWKVPTVQTPNLPATLLMELPNFEATVEPYAYVGLTSPEGILINAGFADAAGNINLPIDVTSMSEVSIVITAQNKIPYISTIPVSAGNSAFLTAKNIKILNESSETNLIGFNSSLNLNFDVINYSTNHAASNLTFEIISNHSGVQVVNNITATSIAAGDTLHVIDQVQLVTSTTILNGQNVGIQIIMRHSDGEQQEATTSLTGAAPLLSTVKMLIDDSQSGNNDHFLNPGESAHVTLIVKNIGTSAMPAANVAFNASAFINISNAGNALNPIPVGGLDTIELDINCNPEIELYTPYILNMEVSFTQHFQTLTFGSTVGALVETFETGDFISVLWDNPNAEWQITDTLSNLSGNFCAESKANVDNGIRTLKTVELDCEGGDEISFWYRTSSETTDKLKFYIDGGTAKGSWGGYNNANAVWNQVTFQVTAGKHVFKWTYEKDNSLSKGADAVWIDDIAFPKVNNISINPPTVIEEFAEELVFDVCQSGNTLNFQFNAKENGKAIIMIFNTLGQNVAAIQTRVEAGENTVTFDTNNLPKGMYVCTLFANGKTNSSKFVK